MHISGCFVAMCLGKKLERFELPTQLEINRETVMYYV